MQTYTYIDRDRQKGTETVTQTERERDWNRNREKGEEKGGRVWTSSLIPQKTGRMPTSWADPPLAWHLHCTSSVAKVVKGRSMNWLMARHSIRRPESDLDALRVTMPTVSTNFSSGRGWLEQKQKVSMKFFFFFWRDNVHLSNTWRPCSWHHTDWAKMAVLTALFSRNSSPPPPPPFFKFIF